MNHPWIGVTCGRHQDRMTTEGKSVQLFSQNTAHPSHCSNGNWEELCLGGLLFLVWPSNVWPDKHLSVKTRALLCCLLFWVTEMTREWDAILFTMFTPGRPDLQPWHLVPRGKNVPAHHPQCHWVKQKYHFLSLLPIRDFSEHGSIFWTRGFMERAPGNCSLDSGLTPDPWCWPSVSGKMPLCFDSKRVEQDPFHQH